MLFAQAVIVALALTLSFSTHAALAADLEIDLSPDASFILDGYGHSCADLAFERDSGQRRYSVAPMRTSIREFKLIWNSPSELLNVDRVTVDITGGSVLNYHTELNADETMALLGGYRSSIPAGMPLNSRNTSTRKPDFPPCGLTVGGIQISGIYPDRFVSDLTVTVYGTAEDSTGTRRAIQATATKQIEYY